MATLTVATRKKSEQPDGMARRETTEVRVVIVGAGPIGLELAIALKKCEIDYVVVERGAVGETITRWPRSTRFYSAPERVAIGGIPIHSPDQTPLTGEEYLAYLRSVVERCDLNISPFEPVVSIERMEEKKSKKSPAGGKKGSSRRGDHRFVVTTNRLPGGLRSISCETVVLATGDMSAPKRLDIPGDDLPHVSYQFEDPHTYFRRRLLVIGGKNSALEAALRCWRAGAEVTISYRHDTFDTSTVKPQLAPEITMLIRKKCIRFLPLTQPVEITPDYVTLAAIDPEDETAQLDKTQKVPTDAVLFCTGYVADMSLFKRLGVTLHGEGERPEYNPETMETDVPGIYVAGTAAGGTQTEYDLFIETCHHHVEKIVKDLGCSVEPDLGSIRLRNYEFDLEDVQETGNELLEDHSAEGSAENGKKGSRKKNKKKG